MVIQKNFPLSQILWYKIGGKTKYLLSCENNQDIIKALEFIEKNKIAKTAICGLGSNLIFSDDYFDGALIRIARSEKLNNKPQKKGEFITVFAGTILDDLIQFAFDNNLIGLEWAGGLPGTVGAGVRGNVGAFGKEIKDTFFSAQILRGKEGKFVQQTLDKNDLNFSYRNSLIKENKNMIITSATFKLQNATKQDLAKARQTYADHIDYRIKHHPVEYPTCGSVFKNISDTNDVKKILTIWPDIENMVNSKWHGKVSMGYIIKRLGFQGLRIGNMQVSEKHANFIVNLGDGRGRDVVTIIKEIQNKIQETFSFIPEIEVEIVSIE